MQQKQILLLSASFVKIRDVELGEYKVGDEIKADLFEAGDIVDVTGTSKGTWFPR